MRFIPSIAHGLADYLVGLAVVSMPFHFGWTGTVRIVFVTLGIIVVCYSLLTDYELGLLRLLRIRFHLLLDASFGIAVLAAPMLLHLPTGNSTIVYVIGALSVLLSFTTKIRVPGTGSEAAA